MNNNINLCTTTITGNDKNPSINGNNLQIKDLIKNNNISPEDIYNSIIGFINVGNSCYINSSIQLIIHCQKFISKFFDNLKLIYKNNNSLVYKFYLIIEEIDKAIKNQIVSIDISFFVYFLYKTFSFRYKFSK